MPFANCVVAMMLLLGRRLILGAAAGWLAKGLLPVLQYVATAKVEFEFVCIAAHYVVRSILLLLLAHALRIQINGHAKIANLAHAIVIEQDIARSQIAVDNLLGDEQMR